MEKETLQINDQVIITKDYSYPHIVRQTGIILKNNLLFFPDWIIVRVGKEIHACQEKHLRKVNQ